METLGSSKQASSSAAATMMARSLAIMTRTKRGKKTKSLKSSETTGSVKGRELTKDVKRQVEKTQEKPKRKAIKVPLSLSTG